MLERPIDLTDIVGDALGLIEQLLGPRDLLLDRLQGRIRQAGQVPRLVEKHLRLVLQAGDLVVDLLQRAGGLQNILGVVRGVIDHHLRADRELRAQGCRSTGQRGMTIGDEPSLDNLHNRRREVGLPAAA